jgi:energy-coupling factor transporter ATP-binding protein EcfA2
MHIQSVRIKNYRGFQDSETLNFSPGFNLIVGANNVGKSSLLNCLAGKFIGEPHKSIHVLPTRDEPNDPISQVDFTVVASGEETRRLLINKGSGQYYIPWPSDNAFSHEQATSVLQRILTAAAIPFRVSAQASVSQVPGGWFASEYPATGLYAPQLTGTGNYPMLRFDVNSQSRTIGQLTPAQANVSHDIGAALAQTIVGKTYQFHAERLGLGVGAYGPNTELAPGAQNLPEVLSALQANPDRFRDYCDFVRQVFPEIQKVSVRPFAGGGSQSEILIWQVDPRYQRDDLAMPLTKCGSGVGQVLAILYVVKSFEQPRSIIIDEPGSFLHPGAARALIGILKGFSQHQYIIATHSPEIISELADAPISIVRWKDAKTSVEQAIHATRSVSAAALTEIGARLGDVFGFDRVIWVEGQSDADAVKALLDASGQRSRPTAILPVRDTGSFQRRKIGEILDIYRKLSMGDALLPPAVLFLFDREGRSERDIEDAVRESRGKVQFLERRMLENYLLTPVAIASLFNEVGAEHGITTTPEGVRDWIVANGTRFLAGNPQAEPFATEWLNRVDGAWLLNSLFQELSESKLEYRKTLHTPRLAVLLHGIDPDATTLIVNLVAMQSSPVTNLLR